jgi:hypothetical protein
VPIFIGRGAPRSITALMRPDFGSAKATLIGQIETLGAWERASETCCVERAEKRTLKHLPSMGTPFNSAGCGRRF